MMAHAYNPSYIGGYDWEDHSSRQKKVSRPHLKGKMLGMVAGACHPSNSGKCKIGGLWSRSTWAKCETLPPK
jgi:hypothetical protein